MTRFITISALLTLMLSYSHAHAFTDGQVLEIIKTRNDGEVLLARHVIAKGKNPAVKKYAQEVLDDHNLNNKRVKEIIASASIKPDRSYKITELQNEIQKSQKLILPLEGKVLDLAYIENQIKTHNDIIAGIKANLIPAAKKPEVKMHLDITLRVKEILLEQAKALKPTL